MRFIHTSDWHLGRRLLNVDLLTYQRDFLQWLLDLAQRVEVDVVVVSGDVYDRAVPSSEAVAVLDRAVASFWVLPLVLISGNHDSPVRLRYGSEVFSQSGIHLARADTSDIETPVVLSDADGDVGFYGIPYPNRTLFGRNSGLVDPMRRSCGGR